MVINVHAGHNPDGKVACGAIGIIRESTEARNVKNEVIRQLRALGHTVYDCTCENGTSKENVLTKIVQMCNAHKVDLDVAIHLNSGRGDYSGDGSVGGSEIFIYNKTSKALNYAKRTAEAMKAKGFRLRKDGTSPADGVKVNTKLYVLNKTKAPAMLVECCFVDDKDDVQLYDSQSMASSIVFGITGQVYEDMEDTDMDQGAGESGAETPTGDSKAIYRVSVLDQRGAFTIKENAERMKSQLEKAGFDAIITKA